MELLNKVNKDSLIKCAKSLSLNTVYIQESGSDGE